MQRSCGPLLFVYPPNALIYGFVSVTVSKSIIDLHRGHISVESAGEHQGCTFTVLLPVKLPIRARQLQSRGSLNSSTNPPPPTVSFSAAIRGENERTEEGAGLGRKEMVDVGRFINPLTSVTMSYPDQLNHRVSQAIVRTATSRLQEQRLPISHSLQTCEVPRESLISTTISQPNDSSNGDGTTPPAEDKEGGRKGRESVESCSGRRPLRVLVVDDASSNRKMLCRVLRSRCSLMVEADNGQKAVDIVRQSMFDCDQLSTSTNTTFDLILMDFVMPVMDGPTAIKEIRDLGYKGVIFGLTGNVLESDKELMLTRGADFVLTKPFKIEVFDRALLDVNEFKKNSFGIST